MGDIGREIRRIEVLPVTDPRPEQPVTPQPDPAAEPAAEPAAAPSPEPVPSGERARR